VSERGPAINQEHIEYSKDVMYILSTASPELGKYKGNVGF